MRGDIIFDENLSHRRIWSLGENANPTHLVEKTLLELLT